MGAVSQKIKFVKEISAEIEGIKELVVKINKICRGNRQIRKSSFIFYTE